tara:strand:- start:806 stop:1312 length:507 start_codon:yes stop_codon:yes gene_type:complete
MLDDDIILKIFAIVENDINDNFIKVNDKINVLNDKLKYLFIKKSEDLDDMKHSIRYANILYNRKNYLFNPIKYYRHLQMVMAVNGVLYVSDVIKNPIYFDLLVMTKMIFDKIINANIIDSNKLQVLKYALYYKLLDDRYLNMRYNLAVKSSITYMTPVITYDRLDNII